MTVDAVQCKKCGYIIFSRARHDFRWCKCKSVAVDGGREYLKITGNPEDMRIFKLELTVDVKALYDDWNNGVDLFGYYPPLGGPSLAKIVKDVPKEPRVPPMVTFVKGVKPWGGDYTDLNGKVRRLKEKKREKKKTAKRK